MNADQKYSQHLSPDRPTGSMNRKPFAWLVIVLIAITVAALSGCQVIQNGQVQLPWAQTPTAEVSAYKTTTVRRSDLTITVSGTGTVITAQSVDLGFSVEGTLAELDVQAGDKVTQGQVLASLRDTAALKQSILDEQLAVKEAQQTLDDLLSGGSSALAQAMAGQASAEKAYAEAQANLLNKGAGRCSKNKTESYYYAYLDAQKSVDTWEGYLNDPNTGYGRDYILKRLTPMRQQRDAAFENWKWCESYTDKEIQTTQAALQLAKAKLDQANAAYTDLKTSSGVDPVQVAIAQAALEDAKLQLSKSQSQLAGTTITAPMNGTITKVNGKVGDDVSTGAFINLSDLEQPRVQVNIDETDLQNFVVGCAADVTFDSLPGETFPGTVTQVAPVLVSVNSTSMVQGLVDLQKKQVASGKTLSIGLTASVEVTCKQAKNALVVPAQALYEPSGASAYVYVLNSQGQPEKRKVVVGLKTVASAEIKSGLSEGEKVVTTQIQSK